MNDSSYRANNYFALLKTLVTFYRPETIVEFGVLNGYSLNCFINNAPQPRCIVAYDIFSDYPYSHASQDILDTHGGYISYGDFFQIAPKISDNSIDLLHIDIGNKGNTYQFFFDNYVQKLSSTGIALLEGGSEERDHCDWMIKYKKPPIRPVLDKYRTLYDIYTFQPYPSLTIIRRK